LAPEEICQAAAGLGLANQPAVNVEAAIERISSHADAARILICGSLYLVGHVLAHFKSGAESSRSGA
jgi:folylpolyglutamate synthase/dihydropteroate synthase